MGGDAIVEGKGFKVPLPRWALNSLAALLILGLIGYGLHWANDRINEARTAISPAEKFQLSEASKHFGESATAEFVAFDDARGALKMMFYGTDGCVAAIRRTGQSGPRQVYFIGDASRASAPPEFAALIPDGGILSAPAFAGGGGRCTWPHGGEYRDGVERTSDPCWIAVHRDFADGCAVTWLRNSCMGYDETNPDGSLKIRCRRGVH